ncbi:MAG TPA: Zn-ribbon domain-containing OB-fold protein [Candidatus Limnocylindrales bacterium]|nr:Zn-ribbon domain-containing OB-fold protein [Candidatus Limnocylindrales bacterium]
MSAKERTIPGPVPSVETQPFWDAATAGKLLAKRCTACHQTHFYPRAICPFCGSDQTEWTEASGRGTVYSYSVFRRAPIPYAIAYVTLAEGVSMMTNIVDCDLDTIRIGQAVRVVFKPSDGGPPVPMFTPAGG